jgi:hypothetical protein
MAEEGTRLIDFYAHSPVVEAQFGLPQGDFVKQASIGRAVFSLYKANAYLKAREMPSAIRWFLQAARDNPAVFFNRRWADLALAKLKRQA